MTDDARTGSPKWQAVAFGPWERHRRDTGHGRLATVAPGLDGRWTWDLWAPGTGGACLSMADGSFATAQEAQDNADRAAAEVDGIPDKQLMLRNGIDESRVPVAFRLVVIEGEGKRCVRCGNGIPPGVAAEETGTGAWLWCGSCATRNPDAALTPNR